jgi:hypothetical protein
VYHNKLEAGGDAGSVGAGSTTRRDLLKAGAGFAAAVSGAVPAVVAPAVAQTAVNCHGRPTSSF